MMVSRTDSEGVEPTEVDHRTEDHRSEFGTLNSGQSSTTQNILLRTTLSTVKSTYRKIEGKLLIFLAGFLGAVAYATAKLVPDMPVGQFSSTNFLFVSFFILPVLAFQENSFNFHGKAKFVIPRSILGGIFGLFHFWTARTMEYGDSIAISSLIPLFAALFSRFLWKEKLSVWTLVALVVGLAGIVLIAKPPFIFGVPAEDEKKEYSPFFPLVPITGSLILGFAYSLMRKVGTQVSPFLISILVSVNSAVDGIIFQFAYGDEFVLPSCFVDRGVLIGGSIALFLSLLFINRGLTLEKSGPGLLMKNCDIVVAYIIQIVFFDSVPDVTSVVGALLVLFSLILVTADKFLFKRYSFGI
ncbi:hypothetical protein ACHWQZ_G011431 [Mnemiopsis leidyi]